MILKIRRDPDDVNAWLWFDGIVRAQAYGWLSVADRERALNPDTPYPMRPSDEHPDSTAMFHAQTELLPVIEHTWGDHREFAHEVWPEFYIAMEGQPAVSGKPIRVVTAERADGSCILAMLDGEAYLLSDTGATVERL